MHIRISEQVDHSFTRSMCRRSWTDFDYIRVLQLRFYEGVDQDTGIVLHDMHSVDIWIVQVTAEFLHFMYGIFFEERNYLGEITF